MGQAVLGVSWVVSGQKPRGPVWKLFKPWGAGAGAQGGELEPRCLTLSHLSLRGRGWLIRKLRSTHTAALQGGSQEREDMEGLCELFSQ